MYGLADGNGYMWDFWIYEGEQPSTNEIVIDFMRKLKEQYLNFVILVVL